MHWITTGCARCGHPDPACTRCVSAAFDVARSAAVYEGAARDAMLRFKLGGERRAAKQLAEAMVRVAPAADIVTSVPGTRRTEKERGFNPAEEIARHVAKAMRLPYRRLLAKTRDTADQAGLSKAQRQQNLAGAFVAIRPAVGRVLLVDDILTTGATANECARALVPAGVGQIAVLTFATAR